MATDVRADPQLVIPEDIETAVSRVEAIYLAELARGGVILEVGAQFGFSTIVLAQTAKLVVSVDWHRGDDWNGWRPSLQIFMDNLARYGVLDRVVAVVARSEVALPVLWAPFDMAFIDGNHSFHRVLSDAKLSRMQMKRNAPFVFHDYLCPLTPEVKPAVDQFACGEQYVRRGPGSLAIVGGR